jgi:hypothetical protein
MIHPGETRTTSNYYCMSLVVDVIWESAFDDDEDVLNFLTPAAGGLRIR